ncbi:hypothetical protein [Amedibacillus sp. YH-ame10]
MSEFISYSEQLAKQIYVLRLCLKDCGKGSVWERNPYLRSSKVKKSLVALHESIERIIPCLMLFIAQYTKEAKDTHAMQRFYHSYAFLYDFNDGIKKEEYDHLILIQNQEMLLKFQNFFYQSERILQDIKQTR